MFHSSKRKIAVSVLALTTILASTQSAFAALTIGATSVRSDGVYNVSGAAASVSEFADLSTTGNITIGKALTTGTLTLGKSDATGIVAVHGGTSAANTLFNNVTGGTIAIGVANTGGIAIGDGATAKAITIGSGAAVNAVTVGSTNTTSATTINAGTGNLNIGNDAVAKITTINIGAQATGQDLIAVGSAHASSTLTLEGGTAAGAILIGNGITAHGIQIGSDATAANAVKLGGAHADSVTTIEGGTAAGAILIGNGATAHGIQIGAGNATQTIKIGDHGTPSNLITIGGALSTTTITGKTILAGSETKVAGLTSVALSLFKTMHFVDADAGGDIFTLADGVEGQITTILMASATGVATVTPANLAGGTSVTLNAEGDTVILQFNGTNWWIVGGNGYSVI